MVYLHPKTSLFNSFANFIIQITRVTSLCDLVVTSVECHGKFFSFNRNRKLSFGLQSHDIKEPWWVACCLFSRWEEDKTWNHIIRLRILSKFQKSPWLYHRSVCPVCISGYICDVLSQPSGCKYRISLIGSFNGSISSDDMSDDMCDDLEGGGVPTINYFLQ